MEGSERKPEKRSYGYEQMELLRLLIEKEKCTTDMVRSLTGVPPATLATMRERLNVDSPITKGSFGGQVGAVNRARKLPMLREKYADEISRLFGKNKSPDSLD